MFIILFIATLILSILFIALYERTDEDCWGILGFLNTLLCLGFLVCLFVSAIDVVYCDKNIIPVIKMYQEENQKIEDEVDILVKNYMAYEEKTFTELKDSDSMTLVNLYPDLKSDQLIQEQIKTYNKNNSKIKKLKSQYLNTNSTRWWLCFGEPKNLE